MSKDLEDKSKEKETKKKNKKHWWNGLFKEKRFDNPSRVAVIYLRNNGVAEPIELETKRGFFNFNNKTYHERRDCLYTTKKERIPLAIIPEWSMIPIGTKRWDDQSMLEKFSELQDHLLRGIRHAELVKMGEKDVGKIDAKKAIGIGLIVLVAAIVLFNYV